ncbi:uncharacterized protein LOC127611727 isoform X2 [Hippocampus zosterae]|uniref:uncharacterized protein LOC127611727 isoform X2 n=1 Tax=Hippocampus zosterae TaxID=109293 RepID=UPI00223E5498|nr:uncharacterized protein LOC127611727 isoform X2 [Hippocampus zosterae]
MELAGRNVKTRDGSWIERNASASITRWRNDTGVIWTDVRPSAFDSSTFAVFTGRASVIPYSGDLESKTNQEEAPKDLHGAQDTSGRNEGSTDCGKTRMDLGEIPGFSRGRQ